MKLYIKNMLSVRCTMVVKSELANLGLQCYEISLGEVEINGNLTMEQCIQLKETLLKSGLDLVDSCKTILVDKIKDASSEFIDQLDKQPLSKISVFISGKLNRDYTYLANLFSKITGNTIEQYIINLKVERVKEFLLYEKYNLTEVSYKLNYSSVAHLSGQFKKVTGLTPSEFKQLRLRGRVAYEMA